MKNTSWIMLTLTLVAAFVLSACGGATATPAGGQPPAGGDSSDPAATDVPATAAPEATTATSTDPDPALPTEATQANPADVVVTMGAAGLDTETNFYRIYGTVRNNAALPISGQIKVVYYDAAGQVVTMEGGEVDGGTFYAPIQPGETGYFFHIRDMARLSGAVDHVEVGLDYAMLEPKSPLAEFSGTEWKRDDDGTLEMKGLVRNTGVTACTIPSVIAILLQGGVPIYADSVPLAAEQLEPGMQAEFEGSLAYGLPAEYDEVVFVLECGPLSFPR